MSTSETTGAKSETVHRSARGRRFAWLAVAAGLLPFLFLEAGLRLFAGNHTTDDLHDGFGGAIPLFTLDEATGMYRTSLARQRFFAEQQFKAIKPPDEFRIFCLGGSTVQGRPFEPDTAFPKWLELELNANDDSHTFRTINCGGVSYASYRLRSVLKEVLNYQPDLVLLATGHNEFLEDQTYSDLKQRSAVRMKIENFAGSLRTVMLLRSLTGGAPRIEPTSDTEPGQSVEARLDSDSGYASYHRDAEWRQQVCSGFSDTLRSMFTVCAEADVPIVAISLGSNLRDCPPFKSEHAAGLSSERQQAWQRLFDNATELETSDAAAALKMYRQAEDIDDQFALLHFRIARCLDRLQQFDLAKDAYRRALMEDICPLRIIPSVAFELAEASADHGVPLVDADAEISRLSAHQIAGFDAYVDHVHPTIGRHQTIAIATMHRLAAAGMIADPGSSDSLERQQRWATHLGSLSRSYVSNGRRRIGWLEGWARRNRLQEEVLPVDVRGYVAAVLRDVELNEFKKADQNFRRAVSTGPNGWQQLLTASARLFQAGQIQEAQWLLQQLRTAGIEGAAEAQIDIADLTMAVAGNDAAQVSALLSKRDNWEDVMAEESAGWMDVVSDLLSKAKACSSAITPKP